MKQEQKALIRKALVDRACKGIDLPKDQSAPLLDIVSPNFLSNTIYSETQKFNVPSNFNSITVPLTSAETGLCGGLVFTLIDSGDTLPLTKTTLVPLKLELSKIAAVVPITNELDQDTSEFLYPFLQTNITKSLRYALDILILYGDPSVCKFTGVMNEEAPATAWIDTAVATTLITQLRAMVDAYYGGKDGKFYVSRTTYNDLIEMTDSVTSDAIQAIGDKLYIYNYPVEVSNVMTEDQILLGDFTQYAVSQKEFRKDISESVYFLTDQKAIRYTFRCGGNAIWDGPLTQEDGTEVYPFVSLDIMQKSSSSV